MVFVGIDPGGTVGWALAGSAGNLITCGEVKSVLELLTLLDTVKPKIVIIEDFRVYGSKARSLTNNDLPASRVLGAVEAWCDMSGVELVKQNASLRKIVSTDILDWLGYLKITKGRPHARDAARHLVYYLWNQNDSPVAKKIAKKLAGGVKS